MSEELELQSSPSQNFFPRQSISRESFPVSLTILSLLLIPLHLANCFVRVIVMSDGYS